MLHLVWPKGAFIFALADYNILHVLLCLWLNKVNKGDIKTMYIFTLMSSDSTNQHIPNLLEHIPL